MPFVKGQIPWNKGRVGVMPKPWNFVIGSERPCNSCNKMFHFSPSKLKQGRAKYCSQNCWMSSVERKELMSRVHKGKKCPFSNPPHFSGIEHWNWQGGKTPEGKRVRNSEAYKSWRKTILKRDNYSCQECGIRGGKLHADHIKSFAFFPELRLSLNNGRTLCVPCHKNTNNYLKGRAKIYVSKD